MKRNFVFASAAIILLLACGQSSAQTLIEGPGQEVKVVTTQPALTPLSYPGSLLTPDVRSVWGWGSEVVVFSQDYWDDDNFIHGGWRLWSFEGQTWTLKESFQLSGQDRLDGGKVMEAVLDGGGTIYYRTQVPGGSGTWTIKIWEYHPGSIPQVRYDLSGPGNQSFHDLMYLDQSGSAWYYSESPLGVINMTGNYRIILPLPNYSWGEPTAFYADSLWVILTSYKGYVRVKRVGGIDTTYYSPFQRVPQSVGLDLGRPMIADHGVGATLIDREWVIHPFVTNYPLMSVGKEGSFFRTFDGKWVWFRGDQYAVITGLVGEPVGAIWTSNGPYKVFLEGPSEGDPTAGLIFLSPVEVDTTTAVEEPGSAPHAFWLAQNYPNPFNPETTIKYQLAGRSEVSLKVYNLLGQEVATLVNTTQEPGVYLVQWNGTNRLGQKVATGVYLFQLKAGDFTVTRKMVMMK